MSCCHFFMSRLVVFLYSVPCCGNIENHYMGFSHQPCDVLLSIKNCFVTRYFHATFIVHTVYVPLPLAIEHQEEVLKFFLSESPSSIVSSCLT